MKAVTRLEKIGRYEYFRGYRNAVCKDCKKLSKARSVKSCNGGELKECEKCKVFKKNEFVFSECNMVNPLE